MPRPTWWLNDYDMVIISLNAGLDIRVHKSHFIHPRLSALAEKKDSIFKVIACHVNEETSRIYEIKRYYFVKDIGDKGIMLTHADSEEPTERPLGDPAIGPSDEPIIVYPNEISSDDSGATIRPRTPVTPDGRGGTSRKAPRKRRLPLSPRSKTS